MYFMIQHMVYLDGGPKRVKIQHFAKTYAMIVKKKTKNSL